MSIHTNRHASYAASHSATFYEVTSSRLSEIEVLRSGYDLNGTKIELTYDPGRNRFSVATRHQYLAHIAVPFDTPIWRRLGIERAGAVFEAASLHGATKIVALVAKKHAMALTPSNCGGNVGFEKEILRRTRNTLDPMPAQTSMLS